MADKKTKYEHIRSFFCDDNDINFPIWMINIYNMLLNLTFLTLWLLFFGYLFTKIDNAYIGVFRSAASYGRNIYIYMAVHYTILFLYLWLAYKFYRQYFFAPRNLWYKTFILAGSPILFWIACYLSTIDTSVVDANPEWEITSSFWFDYYLDNYFIPRVTGK